MPPAARKPISARGETIISATASRIQSAHKRSSFQNKYNQTHYTSAEHGTSSSNMQKQHKRAMQSCFITTQKKSSWSRVLMSPSTSKYLLMDRFQRTQERM